MVDDNLTIWTVVATATTIGFLFVAAFFVKVGTDLYRSYEAVETSAEDGTKALDIATVFMEENAND